LLISCADEAEISLFLQKSEQKYPAPATLFVFAFFSRKGASAYGNAFFLY